MTLPRVHRVTKGGQVFKYHRKTRAPLPRDIPEDHPDFLAAWLAEEQRTAPRKSRAIAGTVEWGCKKFLASRTYQDLSDGYRPVIRRHVEAIAKIGATAKLKDLESRHVAQNLEPLSPAVAKSRLKAWRKLGTFWLGQGMIQADPTRAVKGKAQPKSEGFREWTHADVEAFRAHWSKDTPQRLAFELLQWTGARVSDVVQLGRGMIGPDGVLTFRQKKTGGEVFVPWTAPAGATEPDRRDLLAMTANAPHMVFIMTRGGKARSHKSFSAWFSKAAREAGLVGLSAHGLRKYRMNRLAETGATVLQMQAWVGHATLSEVEHYTRRAQRRAAWGLEKKGKANE